MANYDVQQVLIDQGASYDKMNPDFSTPMPCIQGSPPLQGLRSAKF